MNHLADAELLRRVTDVLVQKYRPERIILFGSYAYGRPTDSSDIDLLIVKRTRLPFHKRWARVCELVEELVGTIPFSPLVVTPAELRRRLAVGDPFFREILSRGQVLYG